MKIHSQKVIDTMNEGINTCTIGNLQLSLMISYVKQLQMYYVRMNNFKKIKIIVHLHLTLFI